MTPDQIYDRFKIQSQISTWKVIAAIFIMTSFFLLIVLKSEDDLLSVASNSKYIARISIDGEIVNDLYRLDSIEGMIKDENIKAVIVRINSPGGTVVGSQNLYHALRRLSKEKLVVAVMDDVAASGGYMTALGCDRIFARESTITGSIGVVLSTFEISELAEKIGVKPVVFRSSEYKASLNPLEKVTPEVAEMYQETIKDVEAMYAKLVAERRKGVVISEVANAKIFTGVRAKELKLIDELGGEFEAKQWLYSKDKKLKDLEVYTYEIDENLNSGVFHSFSSINKFFKMITSEILASKSISIK